MKIIDHDELGSLLYDAGMEIGASFCHGMLSAYHCVKGKASEMSVAACIKQIAAQDTLPPATKRQLHDLAHQIVEALNSPDLDYQLLLAQDDDPLLERATDVAEWCQGFLQGIGLAGEKDIKGEMREFVTDVIAISQLDEEMNDSVEKSSEDEADLMEIVEYLRVGVLSLYEDLNPVTKPPSGQQPTLQ